MADPRVHAVARSAQRDGSAGPIRRGCGSLDDRHRRTRSNYRDRANDYQSRAVARSARPDGWAGPIRRANEYHADRHHLDDRAWPVREGLLAGRATVHRRVRRLSDARHLIDTVMSGGGHPHHDRNSGHDEVQMGKKASPQSTDHGHVVRKRLVCHGRFLVSQIRLVTPPLDSGVSASDCQHAGPSHAGLRPLRGRRPLTLNNTGEIRQRWVQPRRMVLGGGPVWHVLDRGLIPGSPPRPRSFPRS